MNESKYSDLIAKIQRKRKWVIVLTIIAGLFLILFSSHPVLIVLSLILCFFVETIAYAIVSHPLTTSMDHECDPEKYLILNKQLNKQKNIDYIYAGGYLYSGNYVEAIKYSEKMIASTRQDIILSGLFIKIRCEFLLGNYDEFIQTANKYSSALSTCRKLKPKTIIASKKIENIINLMSAISKDDVEGINQTRGNIETWNTTSKATECFVNYIKAVAAYKVDDKEEAIYRFKWVKENGSKTVFANLSDDYLALLK